VPGIGIAQYAASVRGYITFWWRKCKGFHLQVMLEQIFGQEFLTC